MLATISIIQLKEIICKRDQLNHLSCGVQFNKCRTDFDINLFEFSLNMPDTILNFDNPKDISKYRKDCLVAFKQFMIKNNKEYCAGQSHLKIAADIGTQFGYIEFLNLITTNETLSQEFNKYLNDKKFNPLLQDLSNKERGQRFSKLDLLRYDVSIYRQHNVDEFNRKLELCIEMKTSNNIEINFDVFRKVDYSVFCDTNSINDGNSGHPVSSKITGAGNVLKQSDNGNLNNSGGSPQKRPLYPFRVADNVTSNGPGDNSSAGGKPVFQTPEPAPRTKLFQKESINTSIVGNSTGEQPPITNP